MIENLALGFTFGVGFCTGCMFAVALASWFVRWAGWEV